MTRVDTNGSRIFSKPSSLTTSENERTPEGPKGDRLLCPCPPGPDHGDAPGSGRSGLSPFCNGEAMSTHTAQTQLQLIGKLILSGDLHCETGLHIGAGKGSLEIGGADNPVVKDAFGLPYIPGSSLRGKIRSLLEHALGLTSPAELVYLSKRRGQEVRIHQSDRPDDEICLLFGRNPGRIERGGGEAIETRAATPARLTLPDAPLDTHTLTAQMPPHP